MKTQHRTSQPSLVSTAITEQDYRRIHPKLSAKIRRLGVHRYQDVEELVQQSFLEAHKQLQAGKFHGQCALDTWIISIGKNVCLKHYRKQNAQKRKALEISIDTPASDPEAPTLELETSVPWPDHQAEHRDLLDRVKRGLYSLPEMLRDPLVLKAQGHSYREIARLLGIQQKLVSSRIYQARSELLRKLPDSQTPSTR